jgi:hypothetical protein
MLKRPLGGPLVLRSSAPANDACRQLRLQARRDLPSGNAMAAPSRPAATQVKPHWQNAAEIVFQLYFPWQMSTLWPLPGACVTEPAYSSVTGMVLLPQSCRTALRQRDTSPAWVEFGVTTRSGRPRPVALAPTGSRPGGRSNWYGLQQLTSQGTARPQVACSHPKDAETD